MRTNLMQPRSDCTVLTRNTYYTVTDAFTVYALVGHSDSNCYYGASMLCGNVYRRELLVPGDEIHALHGGVFVVRADGELLSVRLTVSEKGAFEKNYGGDPVDRWPLGSLQETTTPHAVSQYPHTFPRVPAGPVAIGRSIDTLTYDPAIAAALAARTLVDVSDEHAVCFAPAEGDGVTAEIFRLWVETPHHAAALRPCGRLGRFYVTDASEDFRVLFHSDTDAREAIRVLHAAQAASGGAL